MHNPCKGPLVGGNKGVHVSERRQPKGRSIEEGRIVWEGEQRGGLGPEYLGPWESGGGGKKIPLRVVGCRWWMLPKYHYLVDSRTHVSPLRSLKWRYTL